MIFMDYIFYFSDNWWFDTCEPVIVVTCNCCEPVIVVFIFTRFLLVGVIFPPFLLVLLSPDCYTTNFGFIIKLF